MPAVIWTLQARRDVEAVEIYYLGVAPAYADVVVAGLLGAARRLETFPLSGRMVPEVGDESIREVLWRDYRIIHWADESVVQILSVLHASRQFGGGAG